jgi:hypothetical protein
VKRLFLWIAVPVLLLSAAMLIAGIGASSLWIAVALVGAELVIVGQVKPDAMGRR